jgi:N-acyl amino acid synthase of PEP-CTERM/exosortase system
MGTLPSLETLRASLPSSARSLSRPDDAASARIPSARLDLLRRFDQTFSETPATSNQDIRDAFRLRYQVYCLDRGFENADACPQGMEQDSHDDQALHCLLRERMTGHSIGTVRLIQPAATPTWFAGLPLADYAPQESMADIMRLPAGTTAEVSRFAITRSAREVLRAADEMRAGHDGDPAQSMPAEKLLPYMSLGLIRGLVRLSTEHGISHWCLAAEPSLLRRLRSFGLHFTDAGPLVDHRGLRQVCYAELATLLARAEEEQPEFWRVITDGGQLASADLARNAA